MRVLGQVVTDQSELQAARKLVHQRKLEVARELYGLSPSDEVPENALNQTPRSHLQHSLRRSSLI